MTLILVIDAVVVLLLVCVAAVKGLERTLPLAACLFLLFPEQCRLELPGLFVLTTPRVMILVLAGLSLGGNKGHDSVRAPIPLRFLMSALVLWMFLSSANSVVPSISLKSSLSQCFDFCLLYLVCARSITSTRSIRNIYAGFVVGLSVCSLLGIVEVYLGWSVTSLFPAVQARFSDLMSESDRGLRVQATFGHPILFGAALALGMPMGIHLLSGERRRLAQAALWISFALMSFCLYKCGSRGPWIAALLSITALFLLAGHRTRKHLIVMVLLGSCLVGIRPGIATSILNTYSQTRDPDSPQGASYQWRYVLMKVAREELSKDVKRGLLGFGPESFYYLGLTTQATVDGEDKTVKVESCDSAIVELMMDTGYVGLLLVLALLMKSAVAAIRTFRRSIDVYKDVYLVSFVNLCAFIFLMTNVELFGWGQQSYMLWMIVAAAVSGPFMQRSSDASPNIAAMADGRRSTTAPLVPSHRIPLGARFELGNSRAAIPSRVLG